MGSISERCFCAFCRTEHVVYRKKHISWLDGVLALSVSLLLMIAIWQDFDPRFLVFFAFALAVSEIFVLIRRRMTIVCVRCGFDPVIYKADPSRAARKVKAHLDRRQSDPLAALIPPPSLPAIVRKASGAPPSTRGDAPS